MSSGNAYLVPLDDHLCVGKGRSLVARLRKAGVLADFVDEELGWYGGGDGPAYPNVRFEWAVVYDSDAYHFIPSATTGPYLATCPACGTGLDDTLYELRDDWPEPHEGRDMSRIRVPCDSCGASTVLRDLTFGIDTAMTRFFVMFADAEPPEWDADFVAAIERMLGCKLRTIMERM